MLVKTFKVLVDNYLVLIVFISRLWRGNECERYPGYKITTSPYVTVQRGLCAHVPCSFTVPSDQKLSRNTVAIWFHFINRYAVISAKKSSKFHQAYGRLFLSGNVSSGDCSYYIEDPRPVDQTTYFFRFEDGPLMFSYGDIKPYVTITELTEKPTISSARLVEGKEVTLTCTSPGRCRNVTPQISWSGNVSGMRLMNYNITHDDGSRSFHSNITFTPRKSDNGSPLYCTVTLQTEDSTTEKQTLNIEYSPSINITIEGVETNETTVIVKDGDNITMRCYVDSNPKASITWYKEDAVVNRTRSFHPISLTLTNVTPSDAGRFLCSAENEHGVARRTVHIIYHSTKSRFSNVMLGAVGGVLLLVLIIIVGAVIIIYFRKKRQLYVNENVKDVNLNEKDDIYCSLGFTTSDVNQPEDSPPKGLQSSAGDDSVYSDDLQYASVAFSKLKSKQIVPKNMETEYLEIRKFPRY